MEGGAAGWKAGITGGAGANLGPGPNGPGGGGPTKPGGGIAGFSIGTARIKIYQLTYL